MRSIFLIALTMLISLEGRADCRTMIEDNLKTLSQRDGQVRMNMAAGGGLTLLLAGMTTAPVAVGLGGLVAAGSTIHYVEKSNLKGLLRAINEAYTFYETGKAGRKLVRLKRKINRRLQIDLSTEELVDAIMDANEDESLCRSKNLNQYAKRIIITLE